MHFDTALNLVWVVLGIVALASTIRAALIRNRHPSAVWLHVIGVALIVAALFPYISATDDLVRTENLTSTHRQHQSSSGKKTPNDNLIRLFETLDTPLACATCAIAITFFAVWVVFVPIAGWHRNTVSECVGRSPPLFIAI